MVSERESLAGVKVVAPFLGRPAELGLLVDAVEEARNGHGRLVLVGGEAGIGKTRLAEEISGAARDRAVEVLWGRCWEGRGAPAFWPWIQVGRQYAARRGLDAVRSAMSFDAPEIVQLIPELSETQATEADGRNPIDPEQARFRQFDSFASFLRRAAQVQPLLLIIDDLHWADSASLLLLKFLSQEIWEAPLVILANYRTSETAGREDVSIAISELARSRIAVDLRLKGLASEDLARFLSEMAGVQPSTSLVAAVYRETEGNPLFAGEIVRLLIQDGQPIADWDASDRRLVVPDTIRDVIRKRLSCLSDGATSLVRIASVIGREFALDLVGRVSGMASVDLLRAVDEATVSKLIQRSKDCIGDYRFTHAVIMETIYDDLLELSCASLHRAVAESIESTLKAGGNSVAALSYHYSRALLTADPEKAMRYAIEAAHRAVDMLAYEDAIEHFGRAQKACELKGGSLGEYCNILLDLGTVYNKAGTQDLARNVFRRAADIGKQVGSIELVALSALGFGGVFPATGAADAELVTRLEDAIRGYGANASATHSMLLAGLSISLHFHGAVERRMDLSERAVSMARQVGDRVAELFALDSKYYAFLRPAGLQERVRIAREMGCLARETGRKEMLLRSHLWLCNDLFQLGDIAGADAEIEMAESLANDIRQPSYGWQVALKRATRALMRGEYQAAESLGKNALAIGNRAKDARAVTSFLGQKMWAWRDLGRISDLENDTASLAVRYPDIPLWTAAQLFIQAERGYSDRLHKAFDELLIQVISDTRQDAFTLGTLSILAEVCAVLRQEEAAVSLRSLLLPYNSHNVILGSLAVFLGSTAHYIAILDVTVGDMEEARLHFLQALSANERAGARPLTARTRFEYGKLLCDLGRHDEAREQLEAAVVEFEALGMVVCLERGREALGRLQEGGGTVGVVWSVASNSGPDAGPRSMFCSNGDYWTVTFAGKTARLKSVRGFQYIAYLLERANQPVHALDLAVLGLRPSDPSVDIAVASQEALRAGDFGGQGTILDERARVEYRRRLRELSAERDEAERLNDYGRLQRIDGEIEAIETYLTAGSGAGGRSRRWTSPSERARVNVRNSIVAALRSISRHHPLLHRHLQNSIKTGAVCSYVPEQVVSWHIAAG